MVNANMMNPNVHFLLLQGRLHPDGTGQYLTKLLKGNPQSTDRTWFYGASIRISISSIVSRNTNNPLDPAVLPVYCCGACFAPTRSIGLAYWHLFDCILYCTVVLFFMDLLLWIFFNGSFLMDLWREVGPKIQDKTLRSHWRANIFSAALLYLMPSSWAFL